MPGLKTVLQLMITFLTEINTYKNIKQIYIMEIYNTFLLHKTIHAQTCRCLNEQSRHPDIQILISLHIDHFSSL